MRRTLTPAMVAALLLGHAACTARKEQQRQRMVLLTALLVRTGLEAYATDHNGCYPSAELSWKADDTLSIWIWFPGGDPIGIDGKPIPGSLPANPYTGRPYVFGEDLFYYPDRLHPGAAKVASPTRGDCPFVGLRSPRGVKGTIVVLGCTPAGGHFRVTTEVVVVGYGSDTSEPISRGSGEGRVFLTN